MVMRLEPWTSAVFIFPLPTVTMAPKQASKSAKDEAKPTKDEVEFVTQMAKTTKALSDCRAQSCESEVEVVRNASNALLKRLLTLAAEKPKDWKAQADKAQHALMHGKELAALTECSRKHCANQMKDIMKLFKQAMSALCNTSSKISKNDPNAKSCETVKKLMPAMKKMSVGLGA